VARSPDLELNIPNSALARDLTSFVRDVASDSLFRHSTRVYFWALFIGQRRKPNFDRELLYAASMFHDFGLTGVYHASHNRFEVDGANAARSFLMSYGIPEQDLERVWLSIALHTTPGIPEHLHSEIALLHAATALDVVGRGFEEISEEEREAVLSAFPRESGFKQRLIDTFYEGLKHRPETTFGTFNDDFLACRDPSFQRADVCRLILDSPWQD
jgi:HD superfamily phosphodiesterase